ncbi:MAG: hypothetical protein ACK2UW_08250 [Anaerolineales bacterium]|jgi:hypothetical protein
MDDGIGEQPEEALDRLVQSAERLGLELDQHEARWWLEAAKIAAQAEEIDLDSRQGVFGHKLVMLDFSPDDLAHFRRMGRLVEIEDRPGVVETALALSGSSAQSKIQTYPGDADFFERVNILAPTQQDACLILSDVMRSKALSSAQGVSHQLIEVKFGSYPETVWRGTREIPQGSPISWTPKEIEAGKIEAAQADGTPVDVTWEQAALDPGWCKLDWVVLDPVRQVLANASNMLDVTWEAPDGNIIPLDGFLDPYYQEVYLDASSVPIFSKLARHVSADALEVYVQSLEHEVAKYVQKDPVNYGKAAKRMYNIFRLTGRYHMAAYIRELFDEPTAMLYQVWSLIRTIDDCCNPDTPVTKDEMIAECDRLMLAVVDVMEGEQETEIVRRMLHLRDALNNQQANVSLNREAEAARDSVIQVVNNFFYEKLVAMPEIKSFMESV